MGTYRKKPVLIEAVPVHFVLNAARQDWAQLPGWIKDAYEKNGKVKGSIVFASDAVHIATLEGTMIAERADWIIRGVHGELYPCKPDIFAATYEEGS